MDDLMRLPSVSRIHFIECGANTGAEWGNVALPTVQYTHGMLSCCEFTGVLLSTLLDMCGVDLKNGKYVLAEGADGSSMTRTIAHGPVDGRRHRGLGDERRNAAARKWLSAAAGGAGRARRVVGQIPAPPEVGDQPFDTKDETIHYVDLMPDGQHRQYTSLQECKSVITTPSGGQTLLDKGYFNISGLAWSGRGKVRRVDVSVDGGRNWRTARMDGPVLPKA